jgi:hypothetical protein
MAAIQPELASGESVVWAAQPKVGVISHKEDSYLVPLSLLWGGFAIFWEGAASGIWGLSRDTAHLSSLCCGEFRSC